MSVWAPWWQCWGGTLHGENNLESRTERGEFFLFYFFLRGVSKLKVLDNLQILLSHPKVVWPLAIICTIIGQNGQDVYQVECKLMFRFCLPVYHFLSVDDRIDDHISFFYQIKHFLSVTSSDNDGNVGDSCLADQAPPCM